jgi:uncharacterized protein YpmB
MPLARALRALAAAALLVACAAAQAQPAPGSESTAPAAGGKSIDFGKASASVTARAHEPAAPDEATRRLMAEDFASQARHLQWQREYERRGWEWHLLSTQLLFGVVILIVLFGLFITYRQFQRDYSDWEQRQHEIAKAKQKDAGADAVAVAANSPAPSATATTLKVSAEGLEVTSQVVGLIVLALSLAFFFLYVKDVYPIREAQVMQVGKDSAEKKN